MAASIKNAVPWDVTPCSSCKHRRFGGATFFGNVGSYKSHQRTIPEVGIFQNVTLWVVPLNKVLGLTNVVTLEQYSGSSHVLHTAALGQVRFEYSVSPATRLFL
jgi:hypothetical protein